MATHDKRWKWIERLIDFTFEPLESNHCLHTYLDDDDTDTTNNLVATGFVAVIGCLILIPIVRVISTKEAIMACGKKGKGGGGKK